MSQTDLITELEFQRNSIQLIRAFLVNAKLDIHDGNKKGKLSFKLKKEARINEEVAEIFLNATIGSKEETGFVLDITYKGVVRAVPNSKITIEEVLEYSQLHIVPMLLPYIRETATSIISRTEFPPFMLPTLDVINYLKVQLENGE